MERIKKVSGTLFLATAILATVFVSTELVFQSLGKSICPAEGCRMVASYARFGDISILLIGLVIFLSLALLSSMTLYQNRTRLEKYINLILVVALSAEGFFVGYQAFRLHTACVFCLITFGIIILLCLLRLLYGEREVIAGFLSFGAVFALFYLVLPAENTVRMPSGELVLFYSKDCKYCSAVMKELDANKMKVVHLLAGEYSGLLGNLGIEYVPTLFVNRKNQKMFLIGKEAIDQYLLCNREEEPGEKAGPIVNIRPKKAPGAQTNASINAPDILLIPDSNPQNLPLQPGNKGVCSETQKCE
jgi:uncharacterized membrane protein